MTGARTVSSKIAFARLNSNQMTASKRIVGGVCVALLIIVVGCAGLAPVRAQEKSAPPEEPQVRKDTAQHHEGPGRQLAHESREAAGEEKDEMAEFKQSPSVQWVADHTDGDLRHAYWLCIGLNFAVIAIFMVWASRKYLPGMFRNRTAAIQKAMQEAQKASEEARSKLAEIEARDRKSVV